ncbi:MAG: hypothetical protein PVF58_00285 [Candidatus Methanofastidiosia archaeon]|jgi:hypothetical protein
MSPPDGGIDPCVARKLLEVLDKYKYAEKAVWKSVSKSGQPDFSLRLKLHDAVDNIVKALVDNRGNKEKQLECLELAEDILRKIPIEGAKAQAIELYRSILDCLRKPRIFYKITFFSLPDRAKIDTQLKIIEHLLQKGRKLKAQKANDELIQKTFEKAQKEAKTLKDQLPDSDKVLYRFFVILMSFLALIIAIIH